MPAFDAQLELHGKTATGIEVPAPVVESLGGGKRPAVVVTLGTHSYRTTIAPYGGRYLLPVAAEHREAAGLEAGQRVTVGLELDTAPREVEVPEDLESALRKAKKREDFDALSSTARKEHVRSLESAKTAETRARRLAKVLASLGAG